MTYSKLLLCESVPEEEDPILVCGSAVARLAVDKKVDKSSFVHVWILDAIPILQMVLRMKSMQMSSIVLRNFHNNVSVLLTDSLLYELISWIRLNTSLRKIKKICQHQHGHVGSYKTGQ